MSRLLQEQCVLDRETLELLALEAVCACQYYDLADYLDQTTNAELWEIIETDGQCRACNGRF